MKKYIFIFGVISILCGIVSCGTDNATQKVENHVEHNISKTEMVLEHIMKKEDFINKTKIPIIDAKQVYTLIDSNILIVDLRNTKAYAGGHIKGAINLRYDELIDYFQVSGIPEFEKVILVCYTGQSASYAAAILQLKGYSNVCVMNYGMCAWNTKFSKKWLVNSTDKLVGKLHKNSYSKNATGKLPILQTHKNSGIEILDERSEILLDDGFKKASLSIDDLIAGKESDYYIINYMSEQKYSMGHIKNAVQYTPGESLTIETDLLTLPTDKIIVICGQDGQQSTFVAAYLKVLGYNAKSLKYGANGFINSLMLENPEYGHGFDKNNINNFETVEIEYIQTQEKAEEGGC